MGDRTNPIKFGPEWMRNPTSAGPPAGAARDRRQPNNTTAPRILLARLRYGREEMLALFDSLSIEAPPQLKNHEILYHPQPITPCALESTVEDDSRDSTNRQPSNPGLASNDRFPSRARSISTTDNKGIAPPRTDMRTRSRGFVNRQNMPARPWHGNRLGGTYSGMPDDDPNRPLRPWGSSNHPSQSGLRPNSSEQTQYRTKRQTSTNWRQQQGRDDGEEWRSTETSRRQHPDKWAEWGWQQESSARWSQDRQWHNRRTYAAGEANEDPLPEWAVDNAEACGGTFDSTGAFHGYSNDDSNLPKNQENAYPLTKSHTHGSFGRSESSEEWWASEKAKKLIPKRFDASDIQFKKPLGTASNDVRVGAGNASSTSSNNNSSGQKNGAIPKRLYSSTTPPAEKAAEKPAAITKEEETAEAKSNPPASKFEDTGAVEGKSEGEKTAEKRNIQSVILTSNNSLRQKHQNIAVTPTETPKRQPKLTEYLEKVNQPPLRQAESDNGDFDNMKDSESNKIVEDILQMSLDDGIPSATINQLLTNHNNNSSMNSNVQLPYPTMPIRMANTYQGLGMNPQPVQPNSIPVRYKSIVQQAIDLDMTNAMLKASLGLQNSNSSSGLQQGMSSNLSNTGLGNTGMGNVGMSNNAIGNTGMGNAGMGNAGIGNTGMGNAGMGNSAIGNTGMGNAGIGNSAIGNTGMGNAGIGNSAIGNTGMGNAGIGNTAMGNAGMGNSAIGNAGLGNVGMGKTGIGNTAIGNSGLTNTGLTNQSGLGLQGLGGGNMQSSGLQSQVSGLQGFGMQSSNALQNQYQNPMTNNNMQGQGLQGATTPIGGIGNDGLFNNPIQNNLANSGNDNMHSLQRLQQLSSQQFGSMMYGSNLMNQPPPILPPVRPTDLWYYEDPNENIQGPFTPQEMFNWYRAGFFSPSLMVYREVDDVMRPLCSFGPMPFGPIQELMPPYPMNMGGFDLRPQRTHDVLNQKPNLGVDVQSLWGQPSTNTAAADHMWMPSSNNANNVAHQAMRYWHKGSDLPTSSILPEGMKTEDEILAQMRVSQAQTTSPLSFFADSTILPPEEPTTNVSLNMNQLQNIIQKDGVAVASDSTTGNAASAAKESEAEKVSETTLKEESTEISKPGKAVEKPAEAKSAKETKTDKQKPKETKSKNKKGKDDKKEESVESKAKEPEITPEVRSSDPSPATRKKETNKKELEKEKKEWLKEGFTIVKGAEKTKEKKKTDDAKQAEEAERKKKEEEKLAAEEKKKQEALKKQQQENQYQSSFASRQAMESVSKKAPWSASQARPKSREGLTLAEIQRLEREKKLEQMKEQQQMMQIIAQQQTAALAREQEMQTGLGWAKKPTSAAPLGPSLAEIQAEARKQAAAATTASTAVREQAEPTPPPTNPVPWTNFHNGGDAYITGGFWDNPQPQPPKVVKPTPKPETKEPKSKKKVTVMAAPQQKQKSSPAAEFDMWCTNMLLSWRDTTIDVPTFVSFLRDIESPYEVKDYVKCYLGDTRESNEFARQFLEKRSRLMRVGTSTPSDDLCSPAVAVNPRTISSSSASDHADVKTKGKKAKKNKMLKVDARNILGFSVTASEDRINVGDIDRV